ncbi:ion channel [Clostridium tagluense]|uniref:Potassium channel domain-containing protein n=1 Tax=Clostridium tagluense TaxID=360422 RepID=A0A401UU30_9CLOT|nr:ion channel [Clostridium tagluense]GCD13014.1 hypothetical protein Ctaglu_46370 [Clostridium tagluense]
MKEFKSYFLNLKNIKELLIDDGFAIIFIMLLLPSQKNLRILGIEILLMCIIFFFTRSIVTLIFSNAVTILIILACIYSLKVIEEKTSDETIFLMFVFIICCLIFFCMFQTFYIIFKVYTYEINKTPILSNRNYIVILKRLVISIIHYTELALHKIGLMVPFFYYTLLTVLIIFSYGKIYSSINNHYNLNKSINGFYTYDDGMRFDSNIGKDIYNDFPINKAEKNNLIRIPILQDYVDLEMVKNENVSRKQQGDIILNGFKRSFLTSFFSEYNYFSATTFYTVGYGDIEIKGAISKLIVQSEMFMAAIFNIIFIPLILFLIQDYISRYRQKSKERKPTISDKSIGGDKQCIRDAILNGTYIKKEQEDIIKIIDDTPIYYAKK